MICRTIVTSVDSPGRNLPWSGRPGSSAIFPSQSRPEHRVKKRGHHDFAQTEIQNCAGLPLSSPQS
jgi:hypothetical protein